MLLMLANDRDAGDQLMGKRLACRILSRNRYGLGCRLASSLPALPAALNFVRPDSMVVDAQHPILYKTCSLH